MLDYPVLLLGPSLKKLQSELSDIFLQDAAIADWYIPVHAAVYDTTFRQKDPKNQLAQETITDYFSLFTVSS